jgi:hypothetical protein
MNYCLPKDQYRYSDYNFRIYNLDGVGDYTHDTIVLSAIWCNALTRISPMLFRQSYLVGSVI